MNLAVQNSTCFRDYIGQLKFNDWNVIKFEDFVLGNCGHIRFGLLDGLILMWISVFFIYLGKKCIWEGGQEEEEEMLNIFTNISEYLATLKCSMEVMDIIRNGFQRPLWKSHWHDVVLRTSFESRWLVVWCLFSVVIFLSEFCLPFRINCGFFY
jgi:hypothetical protein